MNDKLLKAKYDKLIFELKFLEADLEYHDSVLRDSLPDFDTSCREVAKSRGLTNLFFGERSIMPKPKLKVDTGEIVQGAPKKKVSKEAEKLFKKIAAKTHPDKLLGLTEEEKKDKEEQFLEALEAKDDDNLLKLHILAHKSGIELPDLSHENLEIFERKTLEMKGEIFGKQGTWMWKWIMASEEERKKVMSDYINFMIKTLKGQQKDTE